MIAAAGLTILRPEWLLALPVVGLLALWSVHCAATVLDWDQAVDPPLLRALRRLGHLRAGPRRRTLWPALTAGLIALALLGPARETTHLPAYRNLDGVVIAMDLSRSVAEGGRLAQARAAARLVVESAGSRPVALVVYAGDAYLASPLTTDARALGTTLGGLDGATVPDPGSRPERALALARRVLAQSGTLASDIVLVSDGGGLADDAFREAAAIAMEGGRLSTLYVEPLAPPDGLPRVPSRTELGRIARAGGGLAGDALDPLIIAEQVGAPPAARLADSDLALLLWTDYGRYLLALALVPALALVRRSAS